MKWRYLLLVLLIVCMGCEEKVVNVVEEPIIIIIEYPEGTRVTIDPQEATGNVGITVGFDTRNITVRNYNDRAIGCRIFNDWAEPFKDNWIGGSKSTSVDGINIEPDVGYTLTILYYTFNVVEWVVRAVENWEEMDTAWIEKEFTSTIIFRPVN